MGKTSLIQRLISNSVPNNPAPTVGAFEHKHSIYLNRSSKDLKLEVWDVAGGETYRSLSNMYYRDADGAILVYDVTNRESFESMKNEWLREVNEKAP